MLDTTHDEPDVATAEAPPAPKRPKASTSYDAATDTATVTMVGAEPLTFAAGSLSAAARAAIFGKGFCVLLVTLGDTPAAAFAKLQAGEYGSRKPAGPKELDPWRAAAAHAMVEKSKARKDNPPLALDIAKERAAGITRDQLGRLKTDPMVVKHYAKANPGDDVLGEMLG